MPGLRLELVASVIDLRLVKRLAEVANGCVMIRTRAILLSLRLCSRCGCEVVPSIRSSLRLTIKSLNAKPEFCFECAFGKRRP